MSVVMILSFIASYVSLLCQYDAIHETAGEMSVLISELPEDKMRESLVMVGTSNLILAITMLLRAYIWVYLGLETKLVFLFIFTIPIMVYSDFVIQMFLYYVTTLQSAFWTQNQGSARASIRSLAATYHRLCEVCLNVNRIYSPLLLANLVETFVTLTFGYFYTVFVKLAAIHNVSVWSWSTFVVFKLAKILWICKNSALEVRQTK